MVHRILNTLKEVLLGTFLIDFNKSAIHTLALAQMMGI